MVVFKLSFVEVEGAAVLQFCVDDQLDELLELRFRFAEDKFQV